MDGNYLKTRLRRKKSTVEELHLETTSRVTPKRSYAMSSNNLAKTNRPVPLWLEEQGWSDLKSEVSTFPEPSCPSPRTSQSPDSVMLTKQGLSPDINPVRGLLSHSKQSPSHKKTSPQILSKTQRLSLHIWEEAESSSGSLSAKREEGRKGSLPVSRQLLTYWVKVSDRVPLQKEIEQKKEDEVQRYGTKDVEGGLQSCPMCLQVFPAVFTQMDCDGHLAQCLSDMKMDMTW